jgi:hypothetical protein
MLISLSNLEEYEQSATPRNDSNETRREGR